MTVKGQTPRIRYDEGCLAAHSLNLVGDRWALLVVRELMFAPKRFQMIRAGLPGIAASVLARRLTQLQHAGIVEHDVERGTYALTPAGAGLLQVLESLCRWALTVPGHDPARFISPSALMISMGVNLIPTRALDANAVAGFDFGDEAFEMRVGADRVQTVATARQDAPFVLRGTGNAMAAAVYGPAPLARLIAAGVVSATGDMDAAQGFVDLFGLNVQPGGT